MLHESKCYSRKCRYYQGILQPDDTEQTEVVYCSAFPEGIPQEIAYGSNKHLEPCCGQENEVVYEKATQQAYQVYRVPQE